MLRRVAVSGVAFALAAACSGPSTSASPTALPGAPIAASATQSTPRPTSSIAPAIVSSYLSSAHGYSVALPDPFRRSVRLSLDLPGGRPAWQDAFTARTPVDEAAAAGSSETASPIWNYVVVVQAYTDVGSDTPRSFYTRSGGSIGESIVDTTVDGRQAIKVTNGATYPVQYIVRDGSRILRVAYQLYASAAEMSVPTGATTEKLAAVIGSLRFVP